MKSLVSTKTVTFILSLLLATSLFAQEKNLTTFPTEASPEIVGTRLVRQYLSRNLPASDRRKIVYYPETCTWLGSLWFADAIGNKALYDELVKRFEPLFSEQKDACPNPNHVDLTVFGSIPLEIYQKKKEQRYLNLGLSYADAQWELPKDSIDPKKEAWAKKEYSWQTRVWIDDMFMITAVQSQAYRATGDVKYINRAAFEMVMYLEELQRPNGLFYHTPAVPFYWARGNGWMAVGMVELLRMLPDTNSNKATIMKSYKKMMETLLEYQAEDGMWRQLIDDPNAWKETSGTAMFLYAMITGVQHGWLDANTYAPAVRKGWMQLVTYINEQDEVTDVCQGTGARNDYQYYIDRQRITGDMHGQAPVIWCAYALSRKNELLQTPETAIDHKKLFDRKHIKSVMMKATNWQLANPKHDPRDWTNGAFYAGVFAAWETTQSKDIYKTLMNMGREVEWKPYRRWYHADDIAICQTYIDLYRKEKRPEMIQATIDTLNKLMAMPYPSTRGYDVIKWWWCDALFMGPPTLVKMGISTKNKEYLAWCDAYYKECYDLLYNKDEHLFARDLRYVIKNDSSDRYEGNGKRIFWSRGNGWVMGGLVRILKELPKNYPQYPFYEQLFKEMAAKIISLQQPDGFWRTSLLDPDSYSGGEVSGTGFFCYALAWGVNNKLLDKKTYLPVVEKAWIALNGCVNDEGRVGWVQPIGGSPQRNVSADSWEVYGTGAFLLAGSEVIQLKH